MEQKVRYSESGQGVATPSDIRKNAMRRILSEVVNDAWEVQEEGNIIRAIYKDAYDLTEIQVEDTEQKFYVSVRIARTDEEIIAPESCHDCDPECEFWCEDGCLRDKAADEEISEYLAQPTKEVGILRITPIIWEEKCYLDIPHYHYYKGFAVTAECGFIEQIKAVILFALYCL